MTENHGGPILHCRTTKRFADGSLVSEAAWVEHFGPANHHLITPGASCACGALGTGVLGSAVSEP